MWKGKIFKAVTVVLLSLALTSFGGDSIYTPKVFFDTSKPVVSIRGYDKATAQFLTLINRYLKEKITEHLLRKGIILLFKNGIGSDLTVFYTFPHAYVYKISLKKEIGTTTYWNYGYRIEIALSLYVFKTSSNPQLIYYKTFRFAKYYPPKGEYLPLNLQIAEVVASVFYRKLSKELDKIIEEERKYLNYYKNLGR